jgi:Ca2+/Na+ antiporter
MNINPFVKVVALVVVALVLHFAFVPFVFESHEVAMRLGAIILIIGIGTYFVMLSVANVIEETTDVLQERTHLAGGLLQAFGTAFPDMVIGIVAAFLSLGFAASDYARAVNYAIVAAAATFGSNIYNILYSAWCVARQTLANKKNHAVAMIPYFLRAGLATPMHSHGAKPSAREFEITVDVLLALTFLTMAVVVSMVLFGSVPAPGGFEGDLYQLVRPLGFVLFIVCIGIIFKFRKNERRKNITPEVAREERYYVRQPSIRIWFDLALAGAAILFAAEAMVKAIESFAQITHIPYVIMGAAAGIIGCLGEMITIHQFVINPKGRIGDAVVGVAMDNIVTTLGASVVAIMGGIFLGGSALILIFVIILTANTILIVKIAKLKESIVLR